MVGRASLSILSSSLTLLALCLCAKDHEAYRIKRRSVSLNRLAGKSKGSDGIYSYQLS